MARYARSLASVRVLGQRRQSRRELVIVREAIDPLADRQQHSQGDTERWGEVFAGRFEFNDGSANQPAPTVGGGGLGVSQRVYAID
jgi:hypothetical protein